MLLFTSLSALVVIAVLVALVVYAMAARCEKKTKRILEAIHEPTICAKCQYRRYEFGGYDMCGAKTKKSFITGEDQEVLEYCHALNRDGKCKLYKEKKH